MIRTCAVGKNDGKNSKNLQKYILKYLIFYFFDKKNISMLKSFAEKLKNNFESIAFENCLKTIIFFKKSQIYSLFQKLKKSMTQRKPNHVPL